MFGRRVLFVASLALFAQSCGDDAGADKSKRFLSYDVLINGAALHQSVHLDEFKAPEGLGSASNRFSGSLRLTTTAQSNNFTVIVDQFGLFDSDQTEMQELPPFDFEFVQDDDVLVPVKQGPIANEHRWWEIVLRPGRVWDEAADNGFSRAVIPFALKERQADCIHNGLLTFSFTDAGEISQAAFQISSQTCRYLQFEMHGFLQADYRPGEVQGGADAVANVTRNRRSRIPQRSITQLADDYPGSDPREFGSTEEIEPNDMTLFGFVIDGIHYVGGCNTPNGVYPYCDEMALPSYSTAKSFVGGLGLMLAEKKYPGTASALITEHVPECGDDWDGVTIEHALDMTTGHYGSAKSHVDEDAAIVSRFFAAEDHATKIDFACNQFPRKSDPGEVWVYQTWATYLAGTALNNRLRSILGEDVDFYDDLLVTELWEPLKLSQLAMHTRRTYDDVAQPYAGYGLTLLRDDVAKLAIFLGASDGRLNDEEVFDRSLFDVVKQPTVDDPGMQAELETIHYNNGFRSFDVSGYLECDNSTWLTTMSGFGGINIVLMPNDTAYYYFSDGNVHRYLHAVRESHRIRPMCQ
jgi:beta-lactamase family protein